MKLAAAPTRSQAARQAESPMVHMRVPGGHPRFFPGGIRIYGNYLDEVWTIDDRVGITIADLNDGTGNDRHFYHCNSLYHVYGLTDEAAALKEAYQYDAYGKQTVIVDGNDGDSVVNFSANDVRTVGGNSLINNPYMYTGQRFDPETGLMYYKNRYYSTELGRFVSRDPMGFGGESLGLFEYVSGNPSNSFDPLGLIDSQPEQPSREDEGYYEFHCQRIYGQEFCGPDYTEILMNKMIRGRERLKKRSFINYWATLYEQTTYRDDAGKVREGICPSERCKHYLTICCRCVHLNQIGNMVWEFYSEGKGSGHAFIANVFAEVGPIKKLQLFDDPEDKHARSVGSCMNALRRDWKNKGAGEFCRALETCMKTNILFLNIPEWLNKRKKQCMPCNVKAKKDINRWR